MNELWRHKATGGVYELIFRDARLEWNNSHDHCVYRNVKTGQVWIRPREEFFDGRFEPVGEAQEELFGMKLVVNPSLPSGTMELWQHDKLLGRVRIEQPK